VPVESPGELGLYWVDLAEGRELAVRAVEQRKLQRVKGLPVAELPVTEGPAAGPRQKDVLALIEVAASRAELLALHAEHEGLWSPWLTAKAKHRLTELGAS
jgi:hypothetical protein